MTKFVKNIKTRLYYDSKTQTKKLFLIYWIAIVFFQTWNNKKTECNHSQTYDYYWYRTF